MPPETERCPSKWGADDQRGAANMMTAQTVLQAIKLIRTGEVFELGAILSPVKPARNNPPSARHGVLHQRE